VLSTTNDGPINELREYSELRG